MENEIVVSAPREASLAHSSLPSQHEMAVFDVMAKNAVSSKMYRGIGDQAAVMMIMLSARELGIPAMQALNGGLHIIEGKVEISARMMSALIRKAGHLIKIQESTSDHCILVGKRGDTGEVQSASFSVAEAKLAGLVKPRGGWEKWPADMCFARALSRLARQLFSDVVGIGYVEGEINQSIDSRPVEDLDLKSDDILIVESVSDTEEQSLEKYRSLFPFDEIDLASQYLKVVQKHFEWSTTQTIELLMKDPTRLMEKFDVWKQKAKTQE